MECLSVFSGIKMTEKAGDLPVAIGRKGSLQAQVVVGEVNPRPGLELAVLTGEEGMSELQKSLTLDTDSLEDGLQVLTGTGGVFGGAELIAQTLRNELLC